MMRLIAWLDLTMVVWLTIFGLLLAREIINGTLAPVARSYIVATVLATIWVLVL